LVGVTHVVKLDAVHIVSADNLQHQVLQQGVVRRVGGAEPFHRPSLLVLLQEATGLEPADHVGRAAAQIVVQEPRMTLDPVLAAGRHAEGKLVFALRQG